jgi:hypothetical protein
LKSDPGIDKTLTFPKTISWLFLELVKRGFIAIQLTKIERRNGKRSAGISWNSLG